ncbi:MAG: VWA domain-containing protein [Candidatus Schekmanbacteria bacterium]|nr:VWA domain-containing protein [Candidatus Schekmanbacteria bacterium]
MKIERHAAGTKALAAAVVLLVLASAGACSKKRIAPDPGEPDGMLGETSGYGGGEESRSSRRERAAQRERESREAEKKVTTESKKQSGAPSGGVERPSSAPKSTVTHPAAQPASGVDLGSTSDEVSEIGAETGYSPESPSMDGGGSRRPFVVPGRRSASPGPLSPDSTAAQPIGAVTKATDLVARLVPGEELWIIGKPKTSETPAEDEPATGSLLAELAGESGEVPVPLEHTGVHAHISGYLAAVDVTQRFTNPFTDTIEAKYVFPLPQLSAVSEFVMTVGERRIRGIVRERQEAENLYQEARRQGHVASLLTQERPNVFTQRVANIEPGKAIDISIRYFETLAYVDGWFEYSFPMVVGPRFNPAGSKGGVGSVALGAEGTSGQTTEVSYLRPDQRSGHDIALAVDIDAGVAIEEAASPTHAITSKHLSPNRLAVTLDPADHIPNRDFVLRYRVAGDRVKSALLTHRDERGGFFTLMLYPPAELEQTGRGPMEMVFVLDCSGSMNGEPVTQAKAAIARALGSLRQGDTFQIIRFSQNASALGPVPLAATRANLRAGLKYLASLKGEGGTMMIEGIRAALAFPHDPQRLRIVSFLTDGYIGNEEEILAETARLLGESRIFSVGIGSSVNRYLIERLAKLGRGAAAYLGPGDKADAVMDAFFSRVSHAAMTNLKIDWGQMRVHDVYPTTLPDLFIGRPVVVTGRYDGNGPQRIQVEGVAQGEPQKLDIPTDLGKTSDQHPAIANIWARLHLAGLADDALVQRKPEPAVQIRDLALAFGLMSRYTSFIAVDARSLVRDPAKETVAVPVPVPQGVSFDRAVQEQ